MKRITLSDETRLRLFITGKPGAGKTSLAASAPKPLFINCSGNPLSIRRLQLPHTVDVVDIERFEEINAVYDWLAKGQPENHILVQKGGLTPGYETVVTDTATGLQRLSFQVVAGTAMPGESVQKLEYKVYMNTLRQMTNVAYWFCRLPLHVIFTAQEVERVKYTTPGDNSTAYTIYEPIVEGQSIGEILGETMGAYRLVHRAGNESIANRIKAQRNVLQLQPSKECDWVKDQHNAGIQYMADPTIPKLLELMVQ